jgi:hypothetical protein
VQTSAVGHYGFLRQHVETSHFVFRSYPSKDGESGEIGERFLAEEEAWFGRVISFRRAFVPSSRPKIIIDFRWHNFYKLPPLNGENS